MSLHKTIIIYQVVFRHGIPIWELTLKVSSYLSRKPSNSGNIDVLSSISSILEDDHIEKLENNQWKCLWSNFKFQDINAKKLLNHVIGTKCMHIKRCTASIYQGCLSRYKELQQIKAAKKGLKRLFKNNDISI